ncbi:hypothetical protein B0H11DRAFT_2191616 [Mycena galericulata]|nr:hypothetical protein B0H11DRAFT_2191616 [Mycena galericulata]
MSATAASFCTPIISRFLSPFPIAASRQSTSGSQSTSALCFLLSWRVSSLAWSIPEQQLRSHLRPQEQQRRWASTEDPWDSGRDQDHPQDLDDAEAIQDPSRPQWETARGKKKKPTIQNLKNQECKIDLGEIRGNTRMITVEEAQGTFKTWKNVQGQEPRLWEIDLTEIQDEPQSSRPAAGPRTCENQPTRPRNIQEPNGTQNASRSETETAKNLDELVGSSRPEEEIAQNSTLAKFLKIYVSRLGSKTPMILQDHARDPSLGVRRPSERFI